MSAREEIESAIHDELLRHTSDYRFAEEVAPHLAAVVLPICKRERTEALREVADDLATEAALLRMGPGDKIRRTTLNVAAKKVRRKIRAALSKEAER